MADWIDELKNREDQIAAETRKEAEQKARIDRMIEAKAPLFWEQVIDELRVSCEKLQELFPNNLERRCTVTVDSFTCQLVGGDSPRITLTASINVPAQRLEIKGGESRKLRTISLVLDGRDELRGYDGGVWFTVNDVAEHLVKRACNIL